MSDNSDKTGKLSKEVEKKRRLAQALRENLKKRKAQSRQRTAPNTSQNNTEV